MMSLTNHDFQGLGGQWGRYNLPRCNVKYLAGPWWCTLVRIGKGITEKSLSNHGYHFRKSDFRSGDPAIPETKLLSNLKRKSIACLSQTNEEFTWHLMNSCHVIFRINKHKSTTIISPFFRPSEPQIILPTTNQWRSVRLHQTLWEALKELLWLLLLWLLWGRHVSSTSVRVPVPDLHYTFCHICICICICMYMYVYVCICMYINISVNIMYILCIYYVYIMYILCIYYVYIIYICIMYILCICYEYIMYILCIYYVYIMYMYVYIHIYVCKDVLVHIYIYTWLYIDIYTTILWYMITIMIVISITTTFDEYQYVYVYIYTYIYAALWSFILIHVCYFIWCHKLKHRPTIIYLGMQFRLNKPSIYP